MRNIRKPLATHRARGLTLVEMLMATALTLIMFAAVAQIFGMMGGAMQDARATIELSGNLRSVTNHLQRDLDNLTVEVKPWVQPGSNQGYFEIIEGPDRDVDFANFDVIGDDPTDTTDEHNGSVAGDADDMICFTAYSKDEPFVGLIRGRLRSDFLSGTTYKYWIDRSDNPPIYTPITSQYAEIVYFTKHTPADDRNLYVWSDGNRRDANETVTLYRRVLLIRPDIYLGYRSTDGKLPRNSPPDSYQMSYLQAFNDYDLSLWASTETQWLTNSLEDLQNRYRRVAHNPITAQGQPADRDENDNVTATLSIGQSIFPFPLRPHALLSFEQLNRAIGTANARDRTGEDVLLSRVLAFDIKVFDPAVSVGQDSDGRITLQPGDRGYSTADMTNPMTGAFVDLNWGRSSTRGDETTGANFQHLPWDMSDLHGIGYRSTALFGTPAPTPANLNTTFFLQNPTMANPYPTASNLSYSYYDTWPFSYEITGVDRDGDGNIDNTTSPGTNGFDDDDDGVVDNLEEYETSPPYPVPLRGISITVRAIEDGTRQVRQDTIMADFLPK